MCLGYSFHGTSDARVESIAGFQIACCQGEEWGALIKYKGKSVALKAVMEMILELEKKVESKDTDTGMLLHANEEMLHWSGFSNRTLPAD